MSRFTAFQRVAVLIRATRGFLRKSHFVATFGHTVFTTKSSWKLVFLGLRHSTAVAFAFFYRSQIRHFWMCCVQRKNYTD